MNSNCKKLCYALDTHFNDLSHNYNTLKSENPFYHSHCNHSVNTTINTHIQTSVTSPRVHEKPQEIFIDDTINNLSDLIRIIEKYDYKPYNKYNINMKTMKAIEAPLKKLNSMVGLEDLKTSIVDQLLYFIQGFHVNHGEGDYLHTVLYGKPGTGKTELAKIMGEIYAESGILRNKTFKKVTRSDLIAGYLGQTAIKTKNVIKDSLGGVLFIDEVYALGNNEQRDSFSKECIDTLCESLSHHKKELMVIIAGYKSEIENCFFKYNEGLESRFSWQFNLDSYTPLQIYKIFLNKVNTIGWSLDKDVNETFFEKEKQYFTYNGRDVELFLTKVKIAHSRRVFTLSDEFKKIITIIDLENGMKIFKSSDNIKKRGEINVSLNSLYV